jgi:hypothetical protein
MTAEETFATFIQRERGRLNKEHEKISNQQHELKGKLNAVNRELHISLNAWSGTRC